MRMHHCILFAVRAFGLEDGKYLMLIMILEVGPGIFSGRHGAADNFLGLCKEVPVWHRHDRVWCLQR